ncbi:MAG: NAD(P)/FAD-dependent oxidoreductase [Solirubrobacteraceae bacterium]|nr:NAD(P)/FAD-dependent oxidoreductase [Solirubrobacteraceae bacterium]
MGRPGDGGVERVDVVVVGARCAGSATAIALARQGRSVLVLDGARFPSDTLSTHLFFPAHVAEVARLGALERVRALGAPTHDVAGLWGDDVMVDGPFAPFEGHAHGWSVRRPGFDHALVETAREAGAEVRESTRVTDLVWGGGGRVEGVRWRDRDGEEGTVRADLVVGADGRHSTVARLVGARAHHEVPNHRMMAYAYYRDPPHADRHAALQWRFGRELGTVFPCDGGLSIALLMSPADRADEFRADPTATFEATLATIPPMAERFADAERVTKVRTSYKHPKYFRHSAGPGWALPGDSGHFKDPVTAQGIRDAMRFGRLLGEAVGPLIGDHAAIDRATRLWERDRDDQCLDMYQWANGLGEADEVSPIESAAYRWLAARPDGATEVLDVFSRRRLSTEVFSLGRAARWAADALRHPRAGRAEVWRTLRRDAVREARRRREAIAFTRVRAASARAGLQPPLPASVDGQAMVSPPSTTTV